MTSHIPHHRFEAKLASNPQSRWTPSAEWRTKQVGMFANRLFQRRAAIRQLGSSLRCRPKDEPRMRKRMIANNVSCVGDGARDRRLLAHVTSDHEEGRMNVVLRQHIEQL